MDKKQAGNADKISDFTLPSIDDTGISAMRYAGIMEDSFFNSLSAGDIFHPEGEQLVRTENKTGRNDPCPCGSGKKYKKCCLSNSRFKTDEYTTAHIHNFQQKQSNVKSFSKEEIRNLYPDELYKLDYKEMEKEQLTSAIKVSMNYGEYNLALRYLVEFRKFYIADNGVLDGSFNYRKKTISCDDIYDDYVYELVSDMLYSEEFELLEDLSELFFDKEGGNFKFTRMLIHIKNNEKGEILSMLEYYSCLGITDPEKYVDLFYILSHKYPGLAFLMFRATIGVQPERYFDIMTMSDRIFELIEENDISIIEEPSLETFDTLFSLENPGDTDEKTKDEIETLQQELRQANRESQKQQKKIDKLLKNRNSEPGAELSLDEVPGKRGEQGSSNNDQSVEQFKQQISNGRIKIKKLQNIIREKQNSIQGLKKASKELIFKEMDVSELDSLHEEEYIPLPETSRKVHIPQYSNGFRKTLSTVNPSLARHALQAFTGFTTGDPKYLKQTKTLKTVDNHFSIRIGIHYRLIFEYISGTPPLAKYLIHRKDLEMQLKKM